MSLFAHLYRLLMWSIDAGQPLFLDPAMSPVDSIEDLYYNETGRALIAPITIGESPLGVLYIEAPVQRLWVRRGRYGGTAHCY
jgi:hypothetical protein